MRDRHTVVEGSSMRSKGMSAFVPGAVVAGHPDF